MPPRPGRRPGQETGEASGDAGPARGRGRGPGRGARLFGVIGTRRAAVLAIVVCALALTIAVPLRTYLAQRSEVAQQEQRAQQLRAQVGQLQQRKAELTDPEQVQAEARERLRYVMPGETPYVVQLPGDAQRQQDARHGRPAPRPVDPWYHKLWTQLGDDGTKK